MGFFRYEAVDQTGKVVRGVMNASDENQVVQTLATKGFAARGVFPASGGSAATQQKTVSQAVPQAAPQAPQATARGGGMQSVTVAGLPVSIRSQVPVAALAQYFRQMSTLVRAGIPLHSALSDMYAQTRNPVLKKTLVVQEESARGGRNFSGALSEFPGVFPVHVIASVWAGELSGRLDVALDEIASDLETEASEIRYGRIGWGVAKLHFIILALLIPMSNIIALLKPALEESLKHGSVTSKDVVGFVLANYMKTMFWPSMIAITGMAVLWIAWGFVKRVPAVKKGLDEALINVPLWGALHKDRALARFMHVLNGLYAAGVPQAQAWDAACLTVRNSAIADRLRRVGRQSSSAAGVAERIASSGLFEPEEVALAASGEKTGQVPHVMANMSSNRLDQASARKTRNRLSSVVILELTAGVMVVYVFWKVVNSYCAFAEIAAALMGQ